VDAPPQIASWIQLIRRELAAIGARIAEVRTAIQGHSEAVRATGEGKQRQESAPDKPKEIRAIVSFDDKTVGDTKAERAEYNGIQKGIRNAAWAAFVAATIYAVISLGMWCEMRKTTKAEEGQLALLRDADRPWIDVNILVASPLTDDGKTVQIQFDIIPTNIGRSPTQNVYVDPQLVPARMGDDLTEIQKRACDSAPINSTLTSLHYVLFQGKNYIQPIGLEIPVEKLDALWGKVSPSVGRIDLIPIALVGCVDYTYRASIWHHQTAFAVDILTKEGGMPFKSMTPIPAAALMLRDHPTNGDYPN
jgi:hypothetical protein